MLSYLTTRSSREKYFNLKTDYDKILYTRTKTYFSKLLNHK